MTRENFLVFGAPHILEEDIEAVTDVLRSGWIGTGPVTHELESAFAAYKGVENAHAVNSCTAAIHLSLLAAGIGDGDEVITTALTFSATANAIIHTGAKPVIVDVEPETLNIDPDKVESAITPKTKAILPVHFGGLMCDMDALGQLAERHGLKIIEDCAHAIETERDGVKAGTIGDFGCFSFYVTKNVTTVEGGIILARDPGVFDRLGSLSLHGMNRDAWNRFGGSGYKHYQVVEAGFKYNMTDMQAALGLSQFRRVDTSWHRRGEIWQRYDNALRALPIGLPPKPVTNERHAYHLYTILVDEAVCGIDRDNFLEALKSRQIGCGVHYLALSEHPHYRDTYGWRPEGTPQATRIGRQTVSLPLGPGMNDRDADDVIEAIRDILS